MKGGGKYQKTLAAKSMWSLLALTFHAVFARTQLAMDRCVQEKSSFPPRPLFEKGVTCAQGQLSCNVSCTVGL